MGLRAESADSEPEWQTALRTLRLALSTTQQIHDLRVLVDKFFKASQDEVEACIHIFLDINDVSDPSVSSKLVERWRMLFKELYQTARNRASKSLRQDCREGSGSRYNNRNTQINRKKFSTSTYLSNIS